MTESHPERAGKPILGQIDSRQLTDMAVVVVALFWRHFAGVPGWIQAYKTATSNLLLQTIPINPEAGVDQL